MMNDSGTKAKTLDKRLRKDPSLMKCKIVAAEKRIRLRAHAIMILHFVGRDILQAILLLLMVGK